MTFEFILGTINTVKLPFHLASQKIMEKSIGIIGSGVVGQAVKNFFSGAKIYDKFKPFDTLEEIKQKQYIFVCVPTPFNNGFDSSVIEEVFGYLHGLDGNRVIIKSTVIPGTTERLQKMYPRLFIVSNPEFIDNRTANDDFQNPDKQLVGYTEKSKSVAEEILAMLPRARYERIMPATEAEMVKYMVNAYYATKVIFANQIYDICQKLGIRYDAVREAFEHDRRVAPGNFDVWHGGFRGFDGKCLPKDLASLLRFSEDLGLDLGLLQQVFRINEKLLKDKKNS